LTPAFNIDRRVAIVALRSTSSAFQFALELVEEPPVGGFGNDLGGARLDYAGLAQPQRPEPDRVLRVVDAPLVVGHLLQRLQRIVVLTGIAAIDQLVARAFSLPRTGRQVLGADLKRSESSGARHSLPRWPRWRRNNDSAPAKPAK